MDNLVSRFTLLAVAAILLAPPLTANEVSETDKPAKPTLEDFLNLQARMEELKSSDLPDDQKIAEILKLKNAIGIIWPQLQEPDQAEPLADSPADAEATEPDPHANDPSDLYFQGWLLSRDAGKLADDGKPAGALEKLDRARRIFDRVARDFPDWKPEMVKGRRAQTAETLAILSKQVSPPEPK